MVLLCQLHLAPGQGWQDREAASALRPPFIEALPRRGLTAWEPGVYALAGDPLVEGSLLLQGCIGPGLKPDIATVGCMESVLSFRRTGPGTAAASEALLLWDKEQCRAQCLCP